MQRRRLTLLAIAVWVVLVWGLKRLTERASEPPEERLLRQAKEPAAELDDSLVRGRPELARKAIRDLWEQALALRAQGEPAESTFQAALRLARSVQVCFRDPSYLEATSCYQAFDPHQAQSKREIERLLTEAESAYRRGKGHEAAEGANRAIALCRDLADRWAELRAMHLIGNIHLVAGEVEEARRSYAKTLALARRLRDPHREAAAMNNLAYLEESRGRFREAAEGYRSVWRLGDEHGLPRIKAFALLYQGNLYHRLGVYDRAAAALQDAEEAFHRLGEGRLEALVASNRGAALQRMGHREQALAAYRSSLARRAKEGDRAGRVRTLLHVAELLNELGRPQRALAVLGEILSLTRQSNAASAQRFRWGALLTAGDIHLAAGRDDDARGCLEEAAAIAEDLSHPLDKIETLRRRAELLVRGNDPQGAVALLNRAVRMIEGLRASAELEEERVRFLEAQASVYEGLAGIYLRRMERPVRAFEILERSRARAFLDSLKGDVLIAPDASGAPRVVLTSAAEPASADEIVSTLPRGAALVHYTVTRGGVAILGFDRGGLRSWSVTSLPPDGLVQAAQTFARQGARADVETFVKAGETLSHDLLRPVARLLAEHPLLIIVPDGVLFRIPWAALPWRGRYLVETHEIVIEPSASVFAYLRARPARSSPPDLLLVANPRVGERVLDDGGGSVRPLREAEDEARELTGLAGSSRALVGAQAGESTVVSEMGAHDLLHFATHSFILEEHPLASSLLLAGGRGAVEDTRLAPVSATDGVLTGYEVLELQLKPGALVTLAACESVGRAPGRGEGVVGLARAFFEAGAGGVVASLWPVEDQATRQLMVRFYRELLSRKKTTAAALRAAQSAMARGGAGERRRAPFFWAGFLLIGDGR